MLKASFLNSTEFNLTYPQILQSIVTAQYLKGEAAELNIAHTWMKLRRFL